MTVPVSPRQLLGSMLVSVEEAQNIIVREIHPLRRKSQKSDSTAKWLEEWRLATDLRRTPDGECERPQAD